MTPDSKPCAAGCGRLIHQTGLGPKHFADKLYCCRACSKAHRKTRPGGDYKTLPPQSRDGSKRAMNTHWQRQNAIAKAKAAPIPIRPSREDEEHAIARFVAERGVTRAPPGDQEIIPARQETHRPQPMAGWRG